MELLTLRLKIEMAIDKAIINGNDTTELNDIYNELIKIMYEPTTCL